MTQRLRSIPGVGPIVARVLVAWLVDPRRFKSRSALASYAGLGLGQGITNWQPVGRARASRRGQRGLKRVLFIAARVAISHKNALAQRYEARRAAGWEDRKAIRDIVRCIRAYVRVAACRAPKGFAFEGRCQAEPPGELRFPTGPSEAHQYD